MTLTQSCGLMDTGKDPQVILAFIAQHQLVLKAVLYTHAHIDHIEGYSVIQQAFPDLPVWMHVEEQFWVDALPMQAQMFRMPTPEAPQITGFIQPDQHFDFGTFTAQARFCPGHTPGGISFYVPEGAFLFTGDTLFSGTIGRTDFPKGDFETLMHSIQTQILPLPDDTIIYPGHGTQTTVGQERQNNPFILQAEAALAP